MDNKKNKNTTDKQSELFDLVDQDDKIIGQITRSEAHADKSNIHRAVFVLIFNSKNQILLQKRSMTKDMYPGAWCASCSGHVQTGESYEEAAKQEMSEELGIQIGGDLEFLFKDILYSPAETEYISVYRYITDQQISKSDEEIDQIKFFDLSTKTDKQEFDALDKAPDLAFVAEYLRK